MSDRRIDQVVDLAAQGATDREIAGKLGISRHTVATYWERLRTMWEAPTRAAVVMRHLAERDAERSKRLQEEITRRTLAEEKLGEAHRTLEALYLEQREGMSSLLADVQRQLAEAMVQERLGRLFDRASTTCRMVAYELESMNPVLYRRFSPSAAGFGIDIAAMLEATTTYYDLVHPDDLPLLYEKCLGASYGRGERHMFLYRLLMPEPRWILDTHEALYDDRGRLSGIFGVALDVNELVAAGLVKGEVNRLTLSATSNVTENLLKVASESFLSSPVTPRSWWTSANIQVEYALGGRFSAVTGLGSRFIETSAFCQFQSWESKTTSTDANLSLANTNVTLCVLGSLRTTEFGHVRMVSPLTDLSTSARDFDQSFGRSTMTCGFLLAWTGSASPPVRRETIPTHSRTARPRPVEKIALDRVRLIIAARPAVERSAPSGLPISWRASRWSGMRTRTRPRPVPRWGADNPPPGLQGHGAPAGAHPPRSGPHRPPGGPSCTFPRWRWLPWHSQGRESSQASYLHRPCQARYPARFGRPGRSPSIRG
ncbi:hypothetical protein EON81_20490 [bacterium]|nr:MAG: hypothetical protein EON81_20490 [bacterium]